LIFFHHMASHFARQILSLHPKLLEEILAIQIFINMNLSVVNFTILLLSLPRQNTS
jgi:hypothetical protein